MLVADGKLVKPDVVEGMASYHDYPRHGSIRAEHIVGRAFVECGLSHAGSRSALPLRRSERAGAPPNGPCASRSNDRVHRPPGPANTTPDADRAASRDACAADELSTTAVAIQAIE